MTVLKDFVRLESTGLWRASAEDQRRDVYVFLGDAALTLVDQAEIPLSHWSLPAVVRLNPGQRPALFAPDGNGEETLEIADPDMIDAINRVQRAVRRSRPRRGRLRLALGALTVLGGLGFGFVWLPNAIEARARLVLPPAKIAEIGTRIEAEVIRLSGPVCRGRAGWSELDRLIARVFPGAAPDVTVLELDAAPVMILPGGRILLDRDLVDIPGSADVLAGYLLLAKMRRDQRMPIDRFLSHAGLGASMALLTTGDPGAGPITAEAARLTRMPLDDVPGDAALAPYFAEAGVAMSPFLTHLGRPLPEESMMTPVLDDTSWIALKQVCGD